MASQDIHNLKIYHNDGIIGEHRWRVIASGLAIASMLLDEPCLHKANPIRLFLGESFFPPRVGKGKSVASLPLKDPPMP
jgi:hypothetical protein